MAARILLGVAVVGAVIAYAALSGLWVSTNGAWYQSLDQPPWQPPPWIFGLIWPYNFIVLMVAGVTIAATGQVGRAVAFTGVLAVSIACAVSWSYLFYGPHALTWATACLALAAALTVPLVILSWQERPWLGVILLPYQVWLALATSLSWWYAAHST